MVTRSPFLNRTMITDPDSFFGRKEETKKVFTRLEQLQSVSIWGERKIGRSSLVYYVFLNIFEELGNDYKIAYINLRDARFLTVEDFLRNTLSGFGCNPQVIIDNNFNKNLIVFEESIENLREKCKPVLLIDEFEHIISKSEFNDDFFDTLRTLGANGNIAYITVSLRSLKRLCRDANLNSPFYNIFADLPLGKFSNEETEEFLNGQKNICFTDEEIDFIKKISKNHPLRLQIACNHVFDNRELNLKKRKLKKIIRKDIKYYNDKTTRNVRSSLILGKRFLYCLDKILRRLKDEDD